LGYCREIVVTIAAVCGSGVGPGNVAYWPKATNITPQSNVRLR
jgi:hypothetical protein